MWTAYESGLQRPQIIFPDVCFLYRLNSNLLMSENVCIHLLVYLIILYNFIERRNIFQTNKHLLRKDPFIFFRAYLNIK